MRLHTLGTWLSSEEKSRSWKRNKKSATAKWEKSNWWQYKNVFKNASHWFFYEVSVQNLLQFVSVFLLLPSLKVLRMSFIKSDKILRSYAILKAETCLCIIRRHLVITWNKFSSCFGSFREKKKRCFDNAYCSVKETLCSPFSV